MTRTASNSPSPTHDDAIWYIKNCGLFELLGDDTTDKLAGEGEIVEVKRNGQIYGEGEPGRSVYLIKTGGVKLISATGDGKEVALAYLGPMAVFGETALVDRAPRDMRAIATDDSELLAFNADQVQSLMKAHPSLSLSITKLMGMRLRKIETRLQKLMFRTPRQRLAMLLLELGEDFGEPSGSKGTALKLRITHQEIASLIGVTRESVSYAMGELELEETIHTERRKIFITDRARLATIGR